MTEILVLLEQIAKNELNIGTLNTSNSGKDFHEVAVWQVKSALIKAYEAGMSNGSAIVSAPAFKAKKSVADQLKPGIRVQIELGNLVLTGKILEFRGNLGHRREPIWSIEQDMDNSVIEVSEGYITKILKHKA